MSQDVPLFRIAWDGEDVRNVVDSVTRGSHWANGPYIDEFERSLEAYLGVDHAVTFNSGTTALVSALEAHEIGEGDEVVVPSFTFISTVNAVRLVGAKPVFADIEEDRYGLDPESVRERITDSTAAIVPVHYAGNPCRIDRLVEVATEHDVLVIEDAAEALGARANGQHVGAIGDSAMFSFCQNKIVATGEGGAVVTDDERLAERLRLVRSHGRATGDYFESASGGDYVSLGSNFRMPDVVASIGVAQMEKVESLISRRRSAAEQYSEAFSDVEGVSPPADPPGGRHVYQLYTVTLDSSIDRSAIVPSLAESGVACKVYFDPVHRSRYYQTTYDGDTTGLPGTETVASGVLSLPMYPDLAPEEIDHVVDVVHQAVSEAR